MFFDLLAMHNETYNSISFKDQIYQEKLQQLKSQLDILASGSHPDFLRGKATIEQELENRLFCNEISYAVLTQTIEKDYEVNATSSKKDFEEKKAEMKEQLLNELEERKKQIEHEYANLDLSGDGCEVKQPPKRNLRRRFNETSSCGPGGVNDKKSRKSSPIVNILLFDAEIEDDLKNLSTLASSVTDSSTFPAQNSSKDSNLSPRRTLNYFLLNPSIPSCSRPITGATSPAGPEGFFSPSSKTSVSSQEENVSANRDKALNPTGEIQPVVIKSHAIKSHSGSKASKQVYQAKGKLYYYKKLYLRGQTVILTTPETGRINALLQTIGSKEIGFRTLPEKANSDGNLESKRINVSILHLLQGKCTLKHKSG